MPISTQVEVPQRLRAALLASQLCSAFTEPIFPTGAAGPHTALDLEAVIVMLGYASDQSAVPPISEAPLGEHSRAALELRSLSAAHSCASDVALHQVALDAVTGFAMTDVVQHTVKFLELLRSRSVACNDTPILSQHSEGEILTDPRIHYEGRSRSRRW